MDTARSGCKGCLDPDYMADAERLWKRMKLREGEAVSEEEYQTRLTACEACDALQYGHTCRFCGCLVKWRAKLTSASCPYPQSPKW